MTARLRNLLSGITLLVALVGLGWLIYVFGEIPAWLSRRYAVTVDLTDAGGLTTGSRVLLNGLDIGSIESLHLKDDPSQGVVAIARIDPHYRIPRHVDVRVVSGVFGGAGQLYISVLTAPPGQTASPADKFLPTDGSARLTARSDSFIQRLETSLNQRFEQFDRLAQSISRLSEEYLEVGRRINNLLEPRRPADVDAGTAPANLASILARADADLAELNKTLTAINRLVADEQVQADLRATLVNARQASAGFKDLADRAGRLTEHADKALDDLTRRYVALADDIGHSIDQAQALLSQARAGKGTLGKLVQDPALYDALTDAAQRLSQALKEARLLIQKWKAEGVPIQY